MTTLLPLMQTDNEIHVILYGAKALAYLSNNVETHEKIIKASS